MASLQARSPFRSAHPLFFGNKLASLIVFIVLLCAGWVVLSYVKSDLFDRSRSVSPQSTLASKTAGVSSLESSQLGTPTRLVYSCGTDKDFYHASAHLPSSCDRTALGEEAAIARGLKRCESCFPD